MYLSFLGAAHEVTGSCFYLEACGKKILIDCGMQQGVDEYAHQPVPMVPSEIDYVLLTHAHIDHSGRLPLLAKLGFEGRILATAATTELCSIMLRDSAHIQEFEAEWRNRKGKRLGKEPFEPLYTVEDAEAVLTFFEPNPYAMVIDLCEGIKLRFIDAGHLLGSSSIEIWVEEDGVKKKIVFSGDIGNLDQPLIRDPDYINDADYVIMESTYGDRNHQEAGDYRRLLADVIQRTFDRGGNVVIPSFAVGRTQELLYFLRDIVGMRMVKGHPDIPVYIDSPLAIEATNIFNRNTYGYFDEEAMDLVDRGINPISFPGLKVAVSSDESRAINFDEKSKVIISASGMCEAGRIKHHLKHNLWRPESTIVFVGYQAVGTLGRSLLEGAQSVKLFGEEIQVRAELVRLQGISGHADLQGLLRWIEHISPLPQKVFVVHGENTVGQGFTARLRNMGYDALAPNYASKYDLAHFRCLDDGIAYQPKPERPLVSGSGYRVSSAFGRLMAAGQRLLAVIKQNDQGANKDLIKFADQIDALCDKWER